MIDVGRDDGATAGDLFADEFRRDFLRQRRTERVSRMLEIQVMTTGRGFGSGGLQPEVLPDCDIFHLRGDDTLLGIGQLGRTFTRLGLINLTIATGELHQTAARCGTLRRLGMFP